MARARVRCHVEEEHLNEYSSIVGKQTDINVNRQVVANGKC